MEKEHYIKCEGCGREFTSTETLERHMKIKNLESKVMEKLKEIVGKNSPIYELQESSNRDMGGGFEVVAKNKDLKLKPKNAEEIAIECVKYWANHYRNNKEMFNL